MRYALTARRPHHLGIFLGRLHDEGQLTVIERDDEAGTAIVETDDELRRFPPVDVEAIEE